MTTTVTTTTVTNARRAAPHGGPGPGRTPAEDARRHDLPVTVRVVDARHPSIEPAWRSIEAGDGAVPPPAANGPVATAFSSLTWFTAMRDTMAATHDLRVLEVRRGPHVVGLLPLEWVRDGLVRTVTLAGAWTGGDHLDVVADAAHARTVADAALAHLAGRGDWDRLRFDGVAAGGELSRALGAWRRITPWFLHRPVVLRPVPRVRFDTMRGDGSGVEAISSRSTRRITRVALRALDKDGGGLTVSDRPTNVAADLDALMTLHRRQFGDRSVVMATELRRSFHDEAALRLAAEGRALTWRVDHAGDTLAQGYGFITDATLSVYVTGRAETDASPIRSPGVVANAMLIDWAVGEGFSTLDFLRGDQQHKLLFATEQLATERHEVLRPTVATATVVAAVGAGKLRRRLRGAGQRS